MAQNTAWVTGAAGLIGNQLIQLAAAYAPGLNVVGLTRPLLDLTDFEAVRARFLRDSPSLLIHCAAISSSVLCEAHPVQARLANIGVTAFLADLFARKRMIFFSTDLVFDGRQGNYVETDPTSPLGVYAATKVEAEAVVLSHAQHLVLRTSINGGPSPAGTRGFNEALIRTWRAGRATKLFTDEFRCPIPAAITARATWELAQTRAAGIYHLAGTQRLSRLEIGRLVAARHPDLQPVLEAASVMDYEGAPRAADASLNCGKVQSLLSFKLPGLQEWLESNPKEPF
jgi:dTDP-4-dehydrorhamnose reductase